MCWIALRLVHRFLGHSRAIYLAIQYHVQQFYERAEAVLEY